MLAFAAGVLAARLLGPAGRGHLAAAQTVGLLVGGIGTLSVGEALVFIVGRRGHSPRVVLLTGTALAATSSTLVILVAVAIMPLLLAGEPAAVGPARAYAFFCLSLVFLNLPITLVRALQRFGLWNVLRLIVPLCWLMVVIVFIVTGSKDVRALIVSFLVLQGLFIPIVWLVISRLSRTGGGADLALVKPILRYSTPLFLATLPQTMNARLDQLFVANLNTADQLGRYAVTVAWASLTTPLTHAIASVLFPKIAAMAAEDAPAVFARSSRAAVGFGVLGSSAAAITAPTLIPLVFGHEFKVPLSLSLVLCTAMAILGLNQLLEEGLRGLGRTRSVLMAELAGLAVTIPLLVGLLPVLGIIGAAIASLSGYATVSSVLLWGARAQTKLRFSQLLVPRRADFEDVLKRALMMTKHRRGQPVDQHDGGSPSP